MKKIKDDGFSYPNKISRQVFTKLPVQNLKFEYQDTWTDKKIYDVCFEYNNKKYIVEIDGEQHFYDSKWSTAKEEQANDKYKVTSKTPVFTFIASLYTVINFCGSSSVISKYIFSSNFVYPDAAVNSSK